MGFPLYHLFTYVFIDLFTFISLIDVWLDLFIFCFFLLLNLFRKFLLLEVVTKLLEVVTRFMGHSRNSPKLLS